MEMAIHSRISNDLAAFAQHKLLELQMLTISLDPIVPASSFTNQLSLSKLVSKWNPRANLYTDNFGSRVWPHCSMRICLLCNALEPLGRDANPNAFLLAGVFPPWASAAASRPSR